MLRHLRSAAFVGWFPVQATTAEGRRASTVAGRPQRRLLDRAACGARPSWTRLVRLTGEDALSTIPEVLPQDAPSVVRTATLLIRAAKGARHETTYLRPGLRSRRSVDLCRGSRADVCVGLQDVEPRRLGRTDGERRGRKHLRDVEVHEPVRPRVHVDRLPRCVCARSSRPRARQPGLARSVDEADSPPRDGATASATLRIAFAGNFSRPACQRRAAAALRVYPPNQTAAKTVPIPFDACSRPGPVFLSVRAVTA
jgi:hypothetical protein